MHRALSFAVIPSLKHFFQTLKNPIINAKINFRASLLGEKSVSSYIILARQISNFCGVGQYDIINLWLHLTLVFASV